MLSIFTRKEREEMEEFKTRIIWEPLDTVVLPLFIDFCVMVFSYKIPQNYVYIHQ